MSLLWVPPGYRPLHESSAKIVVERLCDNTVCETQQLFPDATTNWAHWAAYTVAAGGPGELESWATFRARKNVLIVDEASFRNTVQYANIVWTNTTGKYVWVKKIQLTATGPIGTSPGTITASGENLISMPQGVGVFAPWEVVDQHACYPDRLYLQIKMYPATAGNPYYTWWPYNEDDPYASSNYGGIRLFPELKGAGVPWVVAPVLSNSSRMILRTLLDKVFVSPLQPRYNILANNGTMQLFFYVNPAPTTEGAPGAIFSPVTLKVWYVVLPS
jgi:hypothetical protein